MNFFLKGMLLIPLSLTLMMAPLFAQETEPAAEERVEEQESAATMRDSRGYVITPTGYPVNPKETGTSVTVITGEEIEKSGAQDTAEVLRQVPGLTVVRSSRLGGQSSVGVRGLHQKHVLILLDGVELNDPSDSDRAFDMAHLATNNIERIEIYRGPASLRYGSDAAGGVINIITKKGAGAPEVTLKAEAGSYTTFNEEIATQGSANGMDYSVSLARSDSQGFSKRVEGSEKDGYHRTSASSSVGITISDSLSARYAIRYTDGLAETDDYNDDDDNHYFTSQQLTHSLKLTHTILPIWQQELLLTQGTTTRRDTDDDSGTISSTVYQGKNHSAEWFNRITTGMLTHGIGISVEQEEYIQTGSWGNTGKKDIYSFGMFLQERLAFQDMLFLTAGARYDYHETYGSDLNWQSDASFIVPVTETRLLASAGSSFKAPTLYQLYDSSTGNRKLDPEESFTWQAGIEQPLVNKRIIAGITWFQTHFEDTIQTVGVYPNSQYENTGTFDSKGIEASLSVVLPMNVSLDGWYTWNEAKTKDADRQVARRPIHSASGRVNWDFNDRGNVNTTATWRSDYYDNNSNDDKDKGYLRIDLAGSYTLMSRYTLFGRVENLTNADYEEVKGYNTPGISFYGGMKATL